MKLFIHIGTEKTGSSYIQSLLARNREQLWGSSIDYPTAGKWEREMKAGRISPGNGEDLLIAIRGGNWLKLEHLIKRYIESARKRNCNALLFSNENLVEVLSEHTLLPRFLEVLEILEIGRPHFLLVLRDPVDQALSLFKHRAKNGSIKDLDTWIREGYRLPIHLNGFLDQMKDRNLLCTVRKYEKDSIYLTKLFFQEWLGIEWPKHWVDTSVNVSLSLSELSAIRQLRLISPELVPFLYQRLLAVPFSQKSNDGSLKLSFNAKLNNHLGEFTDVWRRCNKLLSLQEQLELPKQGDLEMEHDKTLSFTEKQFEEFLLLAKERKSISFRVDMIKQQVRPKLARIKYAIVSIFK